MTSAFPRTKLPRMKTKAVRIHGVNDLRLEEFELPPIRDDEILAKVVSDSICMSSHKLAMQGDKHKRVRASLAGAPTIIGHEFCGQLVEVGAKWGKQFKAGQKFAIQPALNYHGTLWAPGYSYAHIGGDATYVIVPAEVRPDRPMVTGDAINVAARIEAAAGTSADPVRSLKADP